MEVELVRDFMCRCSEELSAQCDEVVQEVLTKANEGRTTGHEITRENLLTYVVQKLHWEHDAYIKGMPTDQWSAVLTEQLRYNEEEDEWEVIFQTRVECDRLEDAIARTLQIYEERKAKETDEA